MSGNSSYRSAAAFTLIELLVAIAIAAGLLATVYTIFFSLRSGVARVEQLSREQSSVCNVLTIMRREIEGASLTPDVPGAAFRIEESDFYGKPASRLSFLTLARDGLLQIAYYVAEEPDGSRSLKKTVKDVVRQEPGRSWTVLRGVDGFRAQVQDEGFDKAYDSTAAGNLPRLLKLTITTGAGTAAQQHVQFCTPMLRR